MKNKALVTGGAGFVGRHLVRRLIDDGYIVTVLDDLSTGSIKNLHDDALFFEGDIRDCTKLARAVEGCDFIFHLAARVELQKSIMDPADCFSVNVTGTANVVMETMKIPGRRLLFASSCAVYPLNLDKPLSEDMTTSGETPYAMSKVMGERMMQFYEREKDLNCCSLRCFNIYGPGQRSDGPYAAVIPKFIESAKHGVPLKLNGGGMQTRDFIHVDDVVEAYMLMSKTNLIGEFNVGTGTETSIRKLAEIVVKLHGQATMENTPAKPGDAAASCADIAKIKSSSKFTPKFSIQKGLKSIYSLTN